MKKYKNHPFADLFPMMTSDELSALAADVAEHGLRHPVVMYEGMVLDGRNRLLACEQAKIEPTFEEYAGDDPLSLVISLNAQRRDLTAAQRAIVAAKAMDAQGTTWGGDRKSSGGSHHLNGQKSRDVVAKIFKVGPQSIQQAKALHDEAPDLIAQVESCTLSLAAAYEELQERRQQTKQRERDAQRIAEYKDAVSSGEMTMEEAIQQVMEAERKQKEDQAAKDDARRIWWEGLSGAVDWIKRFVVPRDDDHLAWYNSPDGPGCEEHGLTAEAVDETIRQLGRVRQFTFGNHNGTENVQKRAGARHRKG